MSDELEPELKAYFDSKGSAPLEAAQKVDEPAKDQAPEADKASSQDDSANDAKSSQPRADDATAEPDDVADPSDDAAKQADNQRKVSWSAYRREQQQRKEAEARANKLAVEQARYLEETRKRDELLNQRLAMLAQAQNPQRQDAKPAEPEIPDPDQDIFGAAKFAIEKLKQIEAEKAEYIRRKQTEYSENQRRQYEQQQIATRQKQIIDEYNKIGASRAQHDPEFTPAYDYARAKRVEQLMRDEGMNELAAKRQTTLEEFTLVERSLRAGQDPTERIKSYAKDLGFRYEPKGQSAPAPQRLDNLAKAQDAHKTLTGSGSPGSARSVVTAKDLASMSADEFSAFLEKGGDKAFKAAMTR